MSRHRAVAADDRATSHDPGGNTHSSARPPTDRAPVSAAAFGCCGLFCHLTGPQLEGLAAACEEVRFAPGSTVIQQGARERDLFVVIEGRARVVRNAREVGSLAPGAVFGEIALLSGRRRTATVFADTALVLARLSHARWSALRDGDPGLALVITEALASAIAGELIAMTDTAALLFDGRPLMHRRRPRVTLAAAGSERTVEVAEGTPVAAVIASEPDGAPVVAATLGERPVALDTPILTDCSIAPLTLASWDGREVWRRTAGLVFLAAAARIAPQARFHLTHSIGAARIVRASDQDRALREEIEREMHRLIEIGAPVTREQWPLEEARAWFSQRSWDDAARLLPTSRQPTVVVHGLDGTYAHAMGPALPSARALAGVRLLDHPSGLLLDYSAALARWVHGSDDALARERESPRFGSPMQQEHDDWLAAMGVDGVGAFNDLCVSGRVRELIRVSEGFHEKHIGRIADRIAAARDTIRVIAIAGPSSSGKTTFIKRLTVQLEVNGVHPVNLSLDDYYVDRDRCPRDESGELDFEALEALDLSTLHEHVRRLLAREPVRTPHFDFKAGRSQPGAGPELALRPRDVLLIEGIHGLNPALLADAVATAGAFRIFVQPALCLPFDPLTALSPSDVRFLRRIVRDRHGRGTSAAENIQRWPSVRRGEARHIFPHRHHADAVFDSSLAYEMSVLKVYGERYLLEVPSGDPAWSTAYRLRHLLDRFVAIYPDHVPPTSILREFIGGSGFEY